MESPLAAWITRSWSMTNAVGSGTLRSQVRRAAQPARKPKAIPGRRGASSVDWPSSLSQSLSMPSNRVVSGRLRPVSSSAAVALPCSRANRNAAITAAAVILMSPVWREFTARVDRMQEPWGGRRGSPVRSRCHISEEGRALHRPQRPPRSSSGRNPARGSRSL